MSKSQLFIFTILLCCCFDLHDAVCSFRTGEMNPENLESVEKTYKILVTHPEVPKDALKVMNASEVIIVQSLPPTRSEILEKVRGVHGIFWASHEPLTAEVLDAAGPQLKSVSTMSAGIDHIDVGELKKRNIPLGHTPTVLNNAVADLSVGLMLAAARRFQEGREKILSSNWENYHIEWMWGQDIGDATVGFFGFGGIGQAIAKRLHGFDVDHILYTTRRPISKPLEKKFNASKVDFHVLLAESDILFIAAPLTPETREVFNSTAFAKMKKNAVLVNTARGQIINQNDLYNALKSGQIFAAGIDVMTPEPLPSNNLLLSLPNLIVTPHLGSATEKTRTDMAIIAAHNVLRGIAGEPMLSPAY